MYTPVVTPQDTRQRRYGGNGQLRHCKLLHLMDQEDAQFTFLCGSLLLWFWGNKIHIFLRLVIELCEFSFSGSQMTLWVTEGKESDHDRDYLIFYGFKNSLCWTDSKQAPQ